MKKTYMMPETQVVRINYDSMILSGSDPDAQLSSGTVDGEDFESRGSDWDE